MSSHEELLGQGIRRGHAYLESFRELAQDWDGYGGEPITPESIALAHKIMDVVGTDKFVCPADGGVMFEWDVNEQGEHLGPVEKDSGTYIVSILYIAKEKP